MVVLGRRILPRGPDMRHLDRYRLRLSGTDVTFSVPKSNFVASKPSEPFEQSHNLYDLPSLKGREGESHVPEHAYFVSRYLKYYGMPLLRGFIGSIDIKVMVLRLPEFSSLFRPRRFECAIERAIYSMMEFGVGDTRLSWKVETRNESTWANYRYRSYASAAEISRYMPGTPQDDTTYGSVWACPMSGEHLFAINFCGKFLGNPASMHDAFDELERSVMNSMNIELSGEARREKGAVECDCPNESVSEFLPPYEIEKAEQLDELDVIRRVRASLGHDSAIPEATFDKLVKEAMQKQSKEAEEVRRRVLASHLRFKELEEQDYANSVSEGYGKCGS